jgi:hypothetical protein
MMQRNMLIAALVFATATTCLAQLPPSPTDDFFKGRWIVTNVIGYGDISGGRSEAKKLIGKVLSILTDGMYFDKEYCKPNRGFMISEVETAPVLVKYYRIHPTNTGLPARTFLLDSDNCTPVFRMDEHRIVFGWDGVVVRATRDERGRRRNH